MMIHLIHLMQQKNQKIPNLIFVEKINLQSTSYYSSKLIAMSSANQASGCRTSLNYSEDEITHLLNIMDSVLPIGNEEWESVVQHAKKFSHHNSNLILWKMLLHCKNIPTGNPNILPEVKQAKRIKYLIPKKADISDDKGVYNLETNIFLLKNKEHIFFGRN